MSFFLSAIFTKSIQYYMDKLKPVYNVRKRAESNHGLRLSEETKLKMRLAHLGKKKTRSEIEKSANTRRGRPMNALAKTYEGFVSPDGVVYRDVFNLSEFCRIHNLNCSHMNKVNSGKAKSCKGWTKYDGKK